LGHWSETLPIHSGEAEVDEIIAEITRIGVGSARLKCVTPKRVEYFDEAGQECFVDLEECARNWAQLRGARHDRKYRYVAGRGMIEHPHWVEFTNTDRTRLEFWSFEANASCFSGEARELKHLLFKDRWITEDWL
jgi:hypothetical protein